MANPDIDQAFREDPMDEFLHLPFSEEFEIFVGKNFSKLAMRYSQLSDLELDNTIPSEIREVLFYGTRNVVSGGVATFEYFEGSNLLDFNFNVNDQQYHLISTNEETKISTTNYDDSELDYRFDSSMGWRFLLSLLHKRISESSDEAYELPDDFMFIPDTEKVKIALTMLGEASGITDSEYSLNLVDDPMDAAFIIKYNEAHGMGHDGFAAFDITNVDIEMDWQNAEGRYTLVKISTSQLAQQGLLYTDSFGHRVPTDVPHTDYPFAKSVGLAEEPSLSVPYFLNPNSNFPEWQRAVAAAMSRLKKHIET